MHRILERQVERYLGSVPTQPPELIAFLEALSTAMQNADEDRRLLERSIDLSSKEYAKAMAAIRTAQGDLDERTSLLSATLEATADGIFIVDSEGKIVDCNRQFTEMWNIDEELFKKINTLGWPNIVSSQIINIENYTEKVREQNAHPQTQSIDEIYLKNGKVFERYSHPRNIGNNAVGRVVSFRDVTSRKQRETQLKDEKATIERLVEEQTRQLTIDKHILATVASNMIHGTLLMDANRKVVFINDVFKKIIGESVDENTAISALQSKFPSINLDERIAQCVLGRGASSVPEIELSGHVYEILFRYLSDELGRAESVIIFLRDISEQKHEERSRDEFFSIASHELRTPLTAIRGNASMMHDFYEHDMPNNDIREMVDDILESSERLINIVNDFLDVSRLEQGRMKFNLESFDVIPIIKKTVEELRDLAFKKHLTLIGDISEEHIIVTADKDRLKQVLINIIANAINYTEAGSITVRVMVEESFVKILVTDTGVGISKQNQELLFHKFQQAGESLLTRNTTKGTGLGLYISRLMAGEMGGEVRIEESAPLVGSTFSFVIPIAKMPQ